MRTRSHAIARRAFLRALGAVYAIAFASAAVQILGLSGSGGIVPAARALAAARAELGLAGAIARIPTLFWIAPGDAALVALPWAGVALSLLLVAGVAPRPVLAALFALYLSIVAVGFDFFAYQWDALLLEAGFLAIFLAPPGLRPRPLAQEPPPSRAALALLWFLGLRLVFASGVVKLASGDEAWRTLRALEFHFETQPLPTWIGWWAHQLPPWTLRAACAGALAIELFAPIAALVPGRPRRVAVASVLALLLAISVTGNYGFFPLLSGALLILLLDDESAIWPRRWRESARRAASAPSPPPASPAPARSPFRALLLALAAAHALLQGANLALAFDRRIDWPAPALALLRPAARLRVANAYGLFAIMTTERPEIVIEASDDGETWREIPFRWKPLDPARAPGFVAPHMPRLDWTLWFAAMRSAEEHPWAVALLARILEGSPEVRALLGQEEGAPPRYVCAQLYDYRFTTREERRATGAWWRREPRGLWWPVLARRE